MHLISHNIFYKAMLNNATKLPWVFFSGWVCMCRIHTQESALNSEANSQAALSNRTFCSERKVPYLCSPIWQPLTHYLGVSLTKDGEVMHTESHKILLKEMKNILPTKIQCLQSIYLIKDLNSKYRMNSQNKKNMIDNMIILSILIIW